jgi:hypothetical protein
VETNEGKGKSHTYLGKEEYVGEEGSWNTYIKDEKDESKGSSSTVRGR